MSDSEQSISKPQSAAPILAGELELEVVFELGRLRLPVTQIEATQPGYVFRIRSNSEAPVAVRIGGATIGRGKLVSIAGDVGVEIARLGNQEPNDA